MRDHVLTMIKYCESCQKVNRDLRTSQGSMMPLSIPGKPWATLGVDFIVKLPVLSGFDSIMVVVDHYSKGAHFVPAKESWSASRLADAFVKEVFRLHGIPEKFASDRGIVLMTNFWRSVCQKLSIFSAPSTASHPQTDGQVERTNTTLEDYHRHFLGERQDDWESWLSLAEFAFNNLVSSSTGYSPFFANLGYHPQFNTITIDSGVPKADDFVVRMQKVQSDLEETLALAKERQERFYDKGRRVDVVYKAGELVWLSRKFIRTQRPSQKLDF